MCIIRPVFSESDRKEKQTLIFAANELQKYLCIFEGDFSVIPSCGYDSDDSDSIYIGVGLSDKISDVPDKNLDDAICIDVENMSGYITGTNARSVLIGVYRFLKEIGFSFIRPGKNGEHYPASLFFKKVQVCEKASYRHRSICIEGSVFQKNLMDIIDWIPKAAMNGYFMQFQIPREFFDRWYLEETPYRKKKKLSDSDILSIVSLAEEEIEKRSLMYHAVGHGWTSEVVGIDGTSWSVHPEPSEKYRHMLALVDGERKLWEGIPLNTNLCYSNPKVRCTLTDNIVRYCKNHPAVSYLHFWLGDGRNNFCECEECKKRTPSDHYVIMLNELDQKLSSEGLDTKIVFLLYFDLLWKPVIERFKNNDRFVMMFAPISRSYSTSYTTGKNAKVKPYVFNKLEFPKNVEENIAYLRQWQEDFKCDSFDFDYHFMWDHYYDFPQYTHAKILGGDIKALSSIGLNGLVSCQIQRAFLPSSLNMNVMAQTLWNKDSDFCVISENIFKTEFGKNHKMVSDYLSSLSDPTIAKAIRGEEAICSSECIGAMEESIEIIDEFCPNALKMRDESIDKKIALSWKKLCYFSLLYRKMLLVYIDIAKESKDICIDEIRDLVLRNEEEFKDEFDSMYFLSTFERQVIKLSKNS